MRKMKVCSEVLANGGTVAFPTETVYGIGANALNSEAARKIFEAKRRPADNPLIVHIAEIENVYPLVEKVSKKARKLMTKFWPGPLTIIFRKSKQVPAIVTAGLDTVAVRMPNHPIALCVIKESGVPIAAPSANISGKPSPTRGNHVVDDLFGRVDIIINGGDCEVGLESTVLDMTINPSVILRPGGVTKEMIEEVLGERVDFYDSSEENFSSILPKAPGMKYVHYSPNADVIVYRGEKDKITRRIELDLAEFIKQGKKVGIICTEVLDETGDGSVSRVMTRNTEVVSGLLDCAKKYAGANVKSLGDRGELKFIATNVFRILREFDVEEVDIILVEAVDEIGIGKAIMNRLIKASGYNVAEV
ncbi:MAG: threonylcarbamoyl-AMP synthase [Clostridiales bacterium]|nr:threonylcarbamoyl-AMP synthase [Clostridiales bacterium]